MQKQLSWSASKSTIDCPYSNLAWEKSLLEGNFKGDSHFFFYRNSPSLILGRFQVPWREINFLKLVELNAGREDSKIQVVRRRSGGGTVYHDRGNWNFCFVSKDRELNRLEHLGVIQRAMGSFNISLNINERFDLVFEKEDKNYKVSGCAFKQKRETSLHHGTLLIHADLGALKGILGQPKEWTLEGKGVKSTPSPVCNLAEEGFTGSYDLFFLRVCEQLSCEFSELGYDEIDQKEVQALKSWDWLWGETPEFTVNTGVIEMSVKKGFIKSLAVRQDESSYGLDLDGKTRVMDLASFNKLSAREAALTDLLYPFFRL